MSEDCQKCGTAMYELDEDRNCPGCSDNDMYYNWETCEWEEYEPVDDMWYISHGLPIPKEIE